MQDIPDWARAHGPSLFSAAIRSVPSDFVVTEDLSIEFSGDGEHDYLWIEKTGANTQWVAERLAEYAGVPARDAGYSGLKDRHAVTRQWFSVHRPGLQKTDWSSFAADGVEILERVTHRRKLRRGAHKANSFRIALRSKDIEAHRDAIDKRLSEILRQGVPNYFGEQRFGRDAANIELSRQLFAGRRLSRAKRSIGLSAARSFIFNRILDHRVQASSWNTILPGERANLDGSASVFAVDEVSAELKHRCLEHDIHASGTLWGIDAPCSDGEVAQLEQQIAEADPELCAGLVRLRVDAATRALRLRVQQMHWEIANDALWLEFALGRGAYATAVLREIAAI